MDRNIKNRIAIKCILVVLSALVTFFINPNQPLLLVAIISTISGLIGAASYFALPEFSSVFLLARPFIMIIVILPWMLVSKDKDSSLVYLIIDRGILGTAIILNMIGKVYEKIQLFRDWLNKR